MFIDASTYTRNGKIYRRVLLRDSYRVNGKVRHNTIANLSRCSEKEVNALKLALKNKNQLENLGNVRNDIQSKQGLSIGAVWALSQLAKKLGLTQALGNTRHSKLALWLVMACVIEQGSRLSAVRLAQRHNVCDILGVEGFNENDLYAAMDELADRQTEIEKKLFEFRYGDEKPHFYLYDVTSSYFEGEKNELAYYGYNRDKKKGKKQIVIGLMTDDEGRPISIEVFEGNTRDPLTVSHQIKKMAERFDVKEVTFIGDRGMIKQAQIDELSAKHFHYITAITKPQIETLVKSGLIQLSFFEEKLTEVSDGAIRYVLHRNPVRAEEIEATRWSKLESLKLFIEKKNRYLILHPRAKLAIALRDIDEKAKQLKLNDWVAVELIQKTISLRVDEKAKENKARFDGCYAIKTDLSQHVAATEEIHSRYKDLAFVERAFRTMKTTLLEMRGIYVRKANRTRAHVFVVMLGYLLVHELQKLWHCVEVTVEEGIAELTSICSIEIFVPHHVSYQAIPSPRPMGNLLLQKMEVTLPKVIPLRSAIVDTKKKLVKARK
jgi:transposase